MYLGRVIGTVVATRKAKGLEQQRLLSCSAARSQAGKPSGPVEVAVDTVSASPNTLVYLVGSREASLAWRTPGSCPVDAAIVGIVDQVDG